MRTILGYVTRIHARTVHSLFSPADDVKKKAHGSRAELGEKKRGESQISIFVSTRSHTPFAFSCVPTHPIHYTKRGTWNDGL